MELHIRHTTASALASPAPGELHLLPVGAPPDRHGALALLVLEEGLAAFPRGPGRVETIVLDAEASFDDLLASTFVAYRLAHQELPAGCQAFARYADLGRQGVRPSDLPFEQSLEGLYLALRLGAGADLTDPGAAARFLAGWARLLARCILAAAEAGVDPWTTPLGADEPELAAARTLLERDQTLYRADVARGQRWRVKLPGTDTAGDGLFLPQPTCTFVKYWSHGDRDTPTGQPYRFLAVQSRHGGWLFCGDPRSPAALEPLAERLQRADAAQRAPAGPESAWSVERGVVLSPRAGTALSQEQVLDVVRRWTAAKVWRPSRLRPQTAMACCAAMLVFALVGWVTIGGSSPSDPEMDRGFTVKAIPGGPGDPAVTRGPAKRLHLLTIGVSGYRDPKLTLKYGDKDALALRDVLRKQEKSLFPKVLAQSLTEKEASREAIIEALARLREDAAPDDLAVISLSGHGANLDGKDQFYFLPYDFDQKKPASSGVPWSQFADLLARIRCSVLLVVDTCHSGAAFRFNHEPPAGGAQRAVGILTACRSDAKAKEGAQWGGHGVLTFATLEGLQGRYLFAQKTGTPLPKPNAAGQVSVGDLAHFVQHRVNELMGSQQALFSPGPGEVSWIDIPLAVYPHGGPVASK